MPVEFICAECGRELTLLSANEVPAAGLCGACVFHPGWFRDPVIRDFLDPDHDGTELCERTGELPCAFSE